LKKSTLFLKKSTLFLKKTTLFLKSRWQHCSNERFGLIRQLDNFTIGQLLQKTIKLFNCKKVK